MKVICSQAGKHCFCTCQYNGWCSHAMSHVDSLGCNGYCEYLGKKYSCVSVKTPQGMAAVERVNRLD